MSEFAANWYSDPHGRAEFRYWDGSRWTDHVANGGVQSTDPVDAAGQTRSQRLLDQIESGFTVGGEGNDVADQISGTGYRGAGIQGSVHGGGGSILNEPILVVNQKVKLVELTNQYSVFDQNGRQIAAVTQVGQSPLKQAARLFGSMDQFFTHQLEVTDNDQGVVLRLVRPRKVFKSTLVVEDPSGQEIGRIVQKNVVGKINFAIESGGSQLGAIKAENWRAWNFRIEDHVGTEIARITKTFEGIATTMFTTADNYVVQIHQRPGEPLNRLVVASALCVDTALKQDDRGFG